MNEEILWEGSATWKAWAGKWILGWILLPILVGAYFLISVLMAAKGTRWKITSKRIEIESGLMGKKVDSIELWRIRDIEYRQSLTDRMFGVSSLLVTAHDEKTPVVEIRGLPGSRAVYDGLMGALMAARQQRGVANINS